ncbi:DUF1653 domain-containing protein [Glycomyces rhizosphaerae]|uniref:DUF1653 domain-containing protein n=1 Tax=Glycomyces rhizosphaerae TaxID=2054422 RepID=A0ABV7Q8S3_9ACTN
MTESGLYRHYKGGLYEVIGVATHTESREPLVVYRDQLEGLLWVRPEAMFNDSISIGGASQPRFRYIAASGRADVSG